MMRLDPRLAGAEALLDDERAAAILEVALGPRGGRLRELRRTGLRHRAGRRLAARYRARIAWPDGEVDETAVLLVDRHGPPDGVAVVRGEAMSVGVWLYPHDPFLPGLPSAASPEAVGALLAGLGADAGPVTLRPRVYRPTARAVIAARGSAEVYLKVVRPARAADLAARHRALAAQLPVPALHGVAEEQGIVVLEARRGEELGAALVAGRAVPSPDGLGALLDALAPLRADDGTGETPAHQLAAYHDALLAVLPEHASRLAALRAALADPAWHPDRTVHGDFYEAQVLVEQGRVSALLDPDRLRRGDAADDPATLLAHLTVLREAHPTAAARIAAYADGIADWARRRADEGVLAQRTAIQLLGIAPWPWHAGRPDWRARILAVVAEAERLVDERSLIRPQSGTHLSGRR